MLADVIASHQIVLSETIDTRTNWGERIGLQVIVHLIGNLLYYYCGVSMYYFADLMTWIELLAYFIGPLIIVSVRYNFLWTVEGDRSIELKREMVFAYGSVFLLINIGLIMIFFETPRPTILKFLAIVGALLLAIYAVLRYKKIL